MTDIAMRECDACHEVSKAEGEWLTFPLGPGGTVRPGVRAEVIKHVCGDCFDKAFPDMRPQVTHHTRTPDLQPAEIGPDGVPDA